MERCRRLDGSNVKYSWDEWHSPDSISKTVRSLKKFTMEILQMS